MSTSKLLCCRACTAPLEHVFVDLGLSPLANAYPRAEDLQKPEAFYPLTTYVCCQCWLVQLPAAASPETIFGDYAYFSSYSESWLRHAADYVAMATDRFALGPNHRVIEIASNDGYLLRNFVARGIPALGVEPAKNVAAVAAAAGIPTRVAFFGEETARTLCADGLAADLVIANNVLAHTPALNDFVRGLALVLKPAGRATLEFPHLLRLVEGNQFDTIYHEHFSYFSRGAGRAVFAAHGLAVFDVEELPSHGGSLRIFAQRAGGAEAESARVVDLLRREDAAGMRTRAYYAAFDEQVRETKRRLLEFLIDAKRAGKRIAGYGAPAKGNTLLNYCGVRSDFVDYTVDASPHKQGLFLPGTRIPIHSPAHLRANRPDYVWILPWNLRNEIATQMADIQDWGGKFVVAIPRVEIFP